jgi:hypothetical protein
MQQAQQVIKQFVMQPKHPLGFLNISVLTAPGCNDTAVTPNAKYRGKELF